MSHYNNTKFMTENNIINDISEYDACNESKEIFENNDLKLNNNNLKKERRILKTKSEDDEEYSVAAQLTEENKNYISEKNCSNQYEYFSSNKLNFVMTKDNLPTNYNNINQSNISFFKVLIYHFF